MADLFAISNAVIDEGKGIAEVGPINRKAKGIFGEAANESTARIEKERT